MRPFFATLILLFFLPLMFVIAIIIVIDDPSAGPFYKQIRVGRHGKEFYMYKFRTMKANADKMIDALAKQNEMDGPVFKIKKDPRITRVGRFLRKSGIDELPQLWAIFRGVLSFVGPRPEREVFYDAFETYIHGFRERLKVKPGLTGLAQITGGSLMPPEEKIVYDIEYIRNRSFTLDLKLMVRTAVVVLGKVFRNEHRK